jgi:hypothetical protein
MAPSNRKYPLHPGGSGWRREACALFLAEVLVQACRSEPLSGAHRSGVDDVEEAVRECKAYVVPDPSLPMIEAPARMYWTRHSSAAWSRTFSRLWRSLQMDLLRNPDCTVTDVAVSILQVLRAVRDRTSGERAEAWRRLVRGAEEVAGSLKRRASRERVRRARDFGLRLRDIVLEGGPE